MRMHFIDRVLPLSQAGTLPARQNRSLSYRVPKIKLSENLIVSASGWSCSAVM